MQILARIFSLLLHPFLSPIYGILLFQWINPRSTHAFWPINHYIPLFILTCIIPSAGWIFGHQLSISKLPKRRRIKTFVSGIFFIAALILLIAGPFPLPLNPEIIYFFLGLMIAFITYLVILLLGYSTDLHMVGIGNLLAFLILNSLFYTLALTEIIAGMLFLTGLLASTRIYQTKTGYAAIIIGWLIGFTAQLSLFKFWV